MATIIPQNTEEKLAFLNIFKKKFPPEAANLNFSEAEVEKVLSACDTIIFSVTLANQAKLFSKVCHGFRALKLTGKLNNENPDEFIPSFQMPELPAVMFRANAVGYLQKVFARIKSQPNYTEAVGVGLGIVPPKAAPRNLTEAKPKGKADSLPNSVIRIDWKKGKFDGVIVYSKRGDEKTLTEITRDTKPPFIDTRLPLESGKPELREYKLQYMIDDKPVGNASDGISVVTVP